MTVCIAAISTWDAGNGELMIVGASDRMVSAPTIKFEPPQKKIYHFTPGRIIALVAGDPYAQIEICNLTARHYQRQGKQYDSVEELANIYAEVLTGYRRRQAEIRYLKPHGLDNNEFLDRMKDFDPAFVERVKFDLENAAVEVETLIAGMDSTGPHMFLVSDPGVVACVDSIAFAAIGSGKHHAESQFMFARYTRAFPWQNAMLLAYLAKKRAEVTPTVGGETDLFFIGRDGFGVVAEDIFRHVDETYDRLEQNIGRETRIANMEVKNLLDEFLSGHQRRQQPAQHSSPFAATEPEEASVAEEEKPTSSSKDA